MIVNATPVRIYRIIVFLTLVTLSKFQVCKWWSHPKCSTVFMQAYYTVALEIYLAYGFTFSMKVNVFKLLFGFFINALVVRLQFLYTRLSLTCLVFAVILCNSIL